jgi:dTDP-4-amino-4,6-dideoxygalactose transaminase
VSARSISDSAVQILGQRDDPRIRLQSLLEQEYVATDAGLYGSGTQALTVALREACSRVGASTTVALPAFACFDVASAAIGADSTVSFYDVDPDTLGPDFDSLERTVQAGALVIVIAPLYGVPVDWSAIALLAARHGAITIEDAAQGRGARWRGHRLGALGDLSTLSFGRAKGWTGGAGGALLDRSGAGRADASNATTFTDEAGRVVALAAQWALGRPQLYGVARLIPGLGLGRTVYRAPKPITAITRVAAAALLSTYASAMHEDGTRRANAGYLLEAMERNNRVRTAHVQRENQAGFLRLPVRVSGGMAGLASRATSLGIAPSYPNPIAELDEILSRRVGPELIWPGAQALAQELITLPTHSRMSRVELEEVIRVVCGR